MTTAEVVRAWKDPIYRAGLGREDLARIPANPAGGIELTDDQLKNASGLGSIIVTTFRTCTEFTLHRFKCCP